MTIHLIKLSVGPKDLTQLVLWQQQRLIEQKRKGEKQELMHITRHMPKRAAEVLDGGSIYWVIKGWLVARQKMFELRPIVYNGTPHCGLVFAPEMIKVELRPRSAFQGWRYFDPKDAPPDLKPGTGLDMPDSLQRELVSLGLL